jgi:hypothetical protein
VNLRSPEDTLSIALAAAYGLGLLARVIVLFQARRTSRAEDSVKCAEAHAMRCDKCLVEQGELDQPDQPLRHTRTLGLIVVLTAVLLYKMHAPLSTCGPRVFTVLAALPILALLHSTYFLFRIQSAARRQAANVFATSSVPGKQWERRAFVIGHFVFFVIYSFSVLFVITAERALMTPIPLLCMLGLAAVHYVVGFGEESAEARAQCERDGHRWKCTRWCIIAQTQDTEASTGKASEKTTSTSYRTGVREVMTSALVI